MFDNPMLFPCAFEYVYLARPDSIMNGISVYKARLKMGDYLAETIKETINSGDVDVAMPILILHDLRLCKSQDSWYRI